MDVIERLKTALSLNQYMQVSQYVVSNFASTKIELNIETIQALNKIKSFEIEYFNKYEESGAGIKVFDLLMLNPPSQTWGLLGKELILLLQYWLNAVRKHLIIHNNNWWPFLEMILKFIKELGVKEIKLSDVIVRETAECLLDLATHARPDVDQRYKILCALNACAVASRREVRVAMRQQLEVYFIKLASILSSCGDVAIQYSMMETLLRWLLPRFVPELRRDAASKWFPNHLYDKETVTMFVERPWKDFFQDTRDFLNAHNARSDLVTSVICKKLSIGQIVVITGSEKCCNWLDINTSTKRLTIMMEPRLLRTLGCGIQATASEALVITEDNTDAAKLRTIAQEISISVRTLEPAHLLPSTVSVTGENCKQIKMVISSKSDMAKVDSDLRKIFADKYQVLFDIHNVVPASLPKNICRDTSEEVTTFSIPADPIRRIRTGYILKSQAIGSRESSASLAQLHEKLDELPFYAIRHDRMKVPPPSCSKISEASDRSKNCASTTFQIKSFGVCQKSTFLQKQSDAQITKQVKKNKFISPGVADEENSVSCLFVATVGSADESVINDTLERLPKSNPENIIDILVQEALNAKTDKCDKNTDVISREADVTSNNPLLKEIINENNTYESRNKTCTVISNSTSEEIVEGTQFNNIFFKKNIKEKTIMTESERNPVNVSNDMNDKVEAFFTKHNNNPVTEVISPTAARKHNETDSEPSEEDALENVTLNEQIDMESEACLKFIIDSICKESERCDNNLHEISEVTKEPSIQEINLIELPNDNTSRDDDVFKSTSIKSTKRNNITLKFKNTKKPNVKKTQRKLKGQDEKFLGTKKVETADISIKIDENRKSKSNGKHKRKLYSPKDDVFDYKCDETEKFNEAPRAKTYSKSKPMTSYKEIEKERNEYRKKLRTNAKEVKDFFLSPKSKINNDLFDSLKSNTDNNEKVYLVNKLNTTKNANVYNFTSDSEDDDFKTTAVKHVSTKRSPLEKKAKQNNIKKTNSRKNAKPKLKHSIKKERTLIDERMREALPEILDTSFELRRSPRNVGKDPLPNLIREHEMDVIEEVETKNKQKANRRKVNTKLEKKKKTALKNKSNKLNKITNYIKCNETFDKTVSPLPGLTVETVRAHENTGKVSASPKRLEKIKEMYVDSPGRFENLNTTQNLLMDLDQTSECCFQRIEHSAEVHQHSQNNSQSSRVLRSQKNQTPTKKVIESKIYNVQRANKKNKDKNKRRAEIDPVRHVIDISADSNSEKSINTVGASPITAHGDFEMCCNDLPPSQNILNQTIEPRNLEIEGESESIKDLYLQLREEVFEDHMDQSPRKRFKSENFNKESPLMITKIPSDDFIRWLPSIRDSETSSNHSVDELLDKPKSVSNKSVNRSNIKSENLNKNIKRKSQISPIRQFTVEPTNHSQTRSNRSIESDGGEQRRNLFYISKLANDNAAKSISVKTAAPKSGASSTREESRPHSVNRLVKRQSCELHESNKRRKLESLKSGSVESSANVSSSNVNHWMDGCEPSISRDELSQSHDDNIQCIMEKLDTTLSEIHHNTDRRLINMFVEMQKGMSELITTNKEVYEEMIRDFNCRFKSLLEMSVNILENMKSSMKEVIAEDRKQKIAMVRILKEDIQAVVDFNAKRSK